MKEAQKWIPLFLLILIIVLFYALNLQNYFTFSFLQEEYFLLKHFVAEHFFLSLLLFSILYIVIAATSLPIAAFLSILGGFLFGPFLSAIVIDISATLGTTILFLIVRTSVGELFQKKATPWLHKMEKGFQENGFYYLLSLRLVPLFPFWAVTIVAALLGMKVRAFFLGTLIGIIPGAFVYSLVGNGLGALLEKGQAPDLQIIFSPEIFWPLFGLALLSLLPILYKKRKKIL